MITSIAVVVPAANEERRIAACLESLRVAASDVGCAVRIVVVLDGCIDRTEAITRSFDEVQTVAIGRRNVGWARRAGAAHALRDLDGASTLLASTDADSTVPPRWLTHLRDAAATAELVLGTVRPDDGLTALVETAWYERHVLVEGHPHVHAANLAIRSDAYVRIGGWKPLRSGEDEDLVRRAELAGLRVHRTALGPVRTSTRAHGRAPRGFSSYLRSLEHADVG